LFHDVGVDRFYRLKQGEGMRVVASGL
jgi:hypothetical protein